MNLKGNMRVIDSNTRNKKRAVIKKDSYIQKLEARVRNLEKKNDELGKQNKYSDRDRRELEAKV